MIFVCTGCKCYQLMNVQSEYSGQNTDIYRGGVVYGSQVAFSVTHTFVNLIFICGS